MSNHFEWHGRIIEIVQAGPDDEQAVLSVLVEAARWLQKKGLKQWGYYLTNPDQADVCQSLANGDTYLAMADGYTVGTFTLAEEPNDWDGTVWGETPPGTGYIHRVAVRRRFAGLGAHLLRWMEGEARRRGLERLRLDCIHDNKGLNKFYRKRFPFDGRTKVGESFHSRYEKLLP